MGWIAALVTIPALVMLGFMLWRLEGDKGWRGRRLAGATEARRTPHLRFIAETALAAAER
jgi:hypothetical protein